MAVLDIVLGCLGGVAVDGGRDLGVGVEAGLWIEADPAALGDAVTGIVLEGPGGVGAERLDQVEVGGDVGERLGLVLGMADAHERADLVPARVVGGDHVRVAQDALGGLGLGLGEADAFELGAAVVTRAADLDLVGLDAGAEDRGIGNLEDVDGPLVRAAACVAAAVLMVDTAADLAERDLDRAGRVRRGVELALLLVDS